MEVTLSNEFLGLCTAALTAVATVLVTKNTAIRNENERLRGMNESQKKLLDEFAEFLKTIQGKRYVDTNVVILGARAAGKTSFATALTSVWQQIASIAPTPNFQRHQYVFPHGRRTQNAATYKSLAYDAMEHARLVFWDYGGEDHLRQAAIAKMGSLGQCILVLVLDSEATSARRNIEYFSTSFVALMNKALLQQGGATVDQVFILFSKIDLMPKDDSINAIRMRNKSAIEVIESVFGGLVSYCPISSETGFGMATFIRELSARAVDEQGHPKR